MSKIKPAPYRYRECIINPIKTGGFDVIDPTTGRWMHAHTEHSARWWSSVWTRMMQVMASHSSYRVPVVNKVVKPPKLRPLSLNKVKTKPTLRPRAVFASR